MSDVIFWGKMNERLVEKEEENVEKEKEKETQPTEKKEKDDLQKTLEKSDVFGGECGFEF